MNPKLRRRLWTLVMIITGFIFLGSCTYYISHSYQTYKTQKEYEQLAKENTEKVPEATTSEAAYSSPINFDKLSKTNPDIIGWIKIPDTKIDYPIVQTSDNETYLHKDFNGNKNVSGAIFLDCDSNSDFTGWQNIIYGHHMKNGTMFQNLVKFKDKDFFEKHRYLTLYTPEREIHLKTIASFYGDADGQARRTQFDSDKTFKKYVKERISACSFADWPKESFSTVYTFVTCSYELDDARTFLYAVEVP